jgi:hypothetical protein
MTATDNLFESGYVFALYDSVDAAFSHICEVLSNNRNEHARHPRPENLVADKFAVKAFPVARDFSIFDDWKSGRSRSASSRTRQESAELSSAE